jgi:hypothetical protein
MHGLRLRLPLSVHRSTLVCRRKCTTHIDVRLLLSDRVRQVIESEFRGHSDKVSVTVTSIANPMFGHYQCNVAMPLANHTKRNPKDIAHDIVNKLLVDDITSNVEIAGQGFINFRSTFLQHFTTGLLMLKYGSGYLRNTCLTDCVFACQTQRADWVSPEQHTPVK